MTATFIRDNLIAQLDKLPYDLQLRVLDFVKSLIPNPAKPEPNKFQMFFSKLDQKKISATPLL